MSNAGKAGYADIKIGTKTVPVFFSSLAMMRLEELTGKTVAALSVEGMRIMDAINATGLEGDQKTVASVRAFAGSFFCSLSFIANALFAGNLGEKKDKAITVPEICMLIDEAAESKDGGIAQVIFEIAGQVLIPLLRAQTTPKSKDEKKPEPAPSATP